MITRPLLAQEFENLEDVKFPVFVSDKIDGIRCLKVGGKVLTRSFKPIPNKFIREYLEMNAFDGMDGELVTFTGNELDEFNTIQSKVMTENIDPGHFQFWVFDYAPDIAVPFVDRYSKIGELMPKGFLGHIRLLPQLLVENLDDLKRLEQKVVDQGWEGIVLRSLEGRYKCGRSTLKEGILLKYKRFQDDEAIILDILEKETNISKKEVNELGLTKRSHKKEFKVLAGTMGEFFVRDCKTGVEFFIGTGQGLTKELRQELWDNKDKYIGKMLKYKHQAGKNKDLKPRFPSFIGFRSEEDL